ncbi:MAG: ABC transporter ATP-binding protein [Myxococcota bacterium]|nr:antibiotic ABC transporter ATP-binding protein [Spirochaeta sp.]RPG11574.1 MAG: ABC transporter ATP-binding protein [Proteobacteria bacterium TMED72]
MSDPIAYEEEALGKAYDSRLLALLWPFVSPYRWQVLLTLLMVVPMFLIEVAPAWIIKSGLDYVYVPDSSTATESPLAAWILDPPFGWSTILWLALLYLAVALLSMLLQFAHMVLMAVTGQSAMRDLRKAVFDKIQSLHLGFFDQYPVGRLVTRTSNDVENVAEMFTAGVVALITDVFKMIGFAVVLFWVNPKLALATFAVVPFLAVASVIFRLRVREAFRAVRVRIARINAYIQENVTGMKVVQLFTREARNMREFDRMNADHRDAWNSSIRFEALLFAAVDTAAGVTTAIIIWYGTGLVEAGVLYQFIDYMRRFFRPMQDLSAKYSVMQSSMASSERIFQLLETPVEVMDVSSEASPVPVPGLEGTVRFENVWFAYQGEDWVLRDLSFEVGAGERVAFVGATGAGKTTIINLLSRLYEVKRGRILVGGVDIRLMSQEDLRRRVATVLQDVFLFNGSVADNISLGRKDLSRSEIEQAAQIVEAHPFIARLPEGYETEVRERGTNFSAGQRQLLSFARAVAHGGEILVLDEATSSIDRETEALIQRGIHTLMEGKTALAIAHRLSTVQDVDRIYVLDQGRLAESGSHDHLMSLGGKYAGLFDLQRHQEVSTESDSALDWSASPVS